MVIERRVEWSDTDASGHAHNTFVARLLDAAEGVLCRRLGLDDLLGRLPRVRYEASFHHRLWPGDVAEARLRVNAVGRTSMTYDLDVAVGETLTATARCVVVHARPEADRAEPWPETARTLLLTAGPVAGECLTPEEVVPSR